MPVGFGPVLGPVPLADLLNVFYADGNYRSLPGPVAVGPSLGSQALGAFSWYDNTAGQEMIFAAGANAVSALINGAWASVPIFNALSVSVTGFSMSLRLGGFVQALGMSMTFTLGTVSASGQLFNGTLTVASGGGGALGFSSGFYGALTPAADTSGNTITEIAQVSGSTFLRFSTPSLGATYFNTLSFPSYSKTFTSGSATYSTDGSTYSQWQWAGGISVSFTTGNTPVVLA